MLWDVVMPSALPELLNGIRTALALSFILLVSSELIVARKGFGYLIGYLGATAPTKPCSRSCSPSPSSASPPTGSISC